MQPIADAAMTAVQRSLSSRPDKCRRLKFSGTLSRLKALVSPSCRVRLSCVLPVSPALPLSFSPSLPPSFPLPELQTPVSPHPFPCNRPPSRQVSGRVQCTHKTFPDSCTACFLRRILLSFIR
mmetsp:Transcript_15644/g.27014  ORF Transcript_15644/g.27014 Transcript_15644/m.27014 type:complete len:123 (-) Transcript_15644:297-665(-)